MGQRHSLAAGGGVEFSSSMVLGAKAIPISDNSGAAVLKQRLRREIDESGTEAFSDRNGGRTKLSQPAIGWSGDVLAVVVIQPS